jgi:hypothetical protein
MARMLAGSSCSPRLSRLLSSCRIRRKIPNFRRLFLACERLDVRLPKRCRDYRSSSPSGAYPQTIVCGLRYLGATPVEAVTCRRSSLFGGLGLPLP